MGLFGATPVGEVLARWHALGGALGFPRVAHARQVHGAAVLVHDGGGPGILVSDGFDGHAAVASGVLLTVSVADCVPIYVADEVRRVVALLHAGWRGVAAGILEAGAAALARAAGSRPADLRLHLGPAICGRCYEVGPEVHAALGRTPPPSREPVDLGHELARRAVDLGVRPEAVTRSTHCTRCGAGAFFSHRRGDAGRQIAFLGVRVAGSEPGG